MRKRAISSTAVHHQHDDDELEFLRALQKAKLVRVPIDWGAVFRLALALGYRRVAEVDPVFAELLAKESCDAENVNPVDEPDGEPPQVSPQG